MHLHGFIKDVELTEDEWLQAIMFLTATGKKCDDKRQEFAPTFVSTRTAEVQHSVFGSVTYNF